MVPNKSRVKSTAVLAFRSSIVSVIAPTLLKLAAPFAPRVVMLAKGILTFWLARIAFSTTVPRENFCPLASEASYTVKIIETGSWFDQS